MTGEKSPGALKVLVIDDEPFMRRTIRLVLRAAGRFLVDEADAGDAALALLPKLRPDLVLCDIHMPRMDGFQFVERLRNHPEEILRLTPVLMLTASAEQESVLHAASLKVSGYLVKPVSPKLLGGHISAIFQGREAEWRR